MLSIPNPLHPAIVHFPIVLILLGTMVAVVAAFCRRWHLPWLAAGLLAGGALGAIAATWTGGDEQEIVGELPQQTENILEEHEEWGELARNAAILAAFLAIGASSTTRFHQMSRGLGFFAAIASIAASYTLAEAGHHGGQLVYKHGVGINTTAGTGQSTAKEKDDD